MFGGFNFLSLGITILHRCLDHLLISLHHDRR